MIMGYWKTDKSGLSPEVREWTKDDPVYPSPEEFIDKNWHGTEEYLRVIKFLKSLKKSQRFGREFHSVTKMCKGYSRCRICGCINGRGEYVIFGKKIKPLYTIPDGYRHYIECHFIKPPQEFINFCYNL